MKDELIAAVVACALGAGVLWFFDGKFAPVPSLYAVAERELVQAVPLYHRIKMNGPPMLACVQAGRVSTLFSWHADPDNSQAWKLRHDADCARVTLDERG